MCISYKVKLFAKSWLIKQYRGKSLCAKSGLIICISSQWSWCYWKGVYLPCSFFPGPFLTWNPTVTCGTVPNWTRKQKLWPLAANAHLPGREQKQDRRDDGSHSQAQHGQGGISLPLECVSRPITFSGAFSYKYTRKGMLKCHQLNAQGQGKYSRGLVKIAPAVWKLFTCFVGWLPRV